MPRVRAPMWMMALVLGCSGCFELPQEDDPVDPADDDTLANSPATIGVSPQNLNFQQINAGEVWTLPVIIRSIGDVTLHLEDLFIEGPTAFSLDDAATERILAAGSQTTLDVTYTPMTDEEVGGLLHILSNDRHNPDVTLELKAIGLAPVIELSPATWDFGDHEIGCELEQPITLRNIGSSPLTVYEVVFSPTSDELVSSYYFNDGTVLAPGATETVTVYYEPRDELPDTGYLHVYSNDPAYPDALATQYGAAHLPSLVIDEYDQEYVGLVDILWLTDDSGSMADFQDSVNSNQILFDDALSGHDMDIQVDNLLAGENLLSTAAMMLTPPMTEQGGPMEGFLREGAGLQVMIISDEDDQSAGDVSDYVDTLLSLKADPAHVRVSAISGQASGCTDGLATAMEAPRLEQAVTLSGGDSASICDPSWYLQLDTHSWLPHAWKDSFELNYIPIEETIDVQLNQVSVQVGWAFDDVVNAIVFEPDYVPVAGDLITISYHPLGGC